ncbi:hypothetical protein FKM82_026624 [Ascaphus truei]
MTWQKMTHILYRAGMERDKNVPVIFCMNLFSHLARPCETAGSGENVLVLRQHIIRSAPCMYHFIYSVPATCAALHSITMGAKYMPNSGNKCNR